MAMPAIPFVVEVVGNVFPLVVDVAYSHILHQILDWTCVDVAENLTFGVKSTIVDITSGATGNLERGQLPETNQSEQRGLFERPTLKTQVLK